MKYLKQIFTFNALSIVIGSVGSVIGILVFFVPSIQNSTVDTKILLGVIFIAVTISMVSLKIAYDATTANNKNTLASDLYMIPFRYVDGLNVLLVQNSNIFQYDHMVTLYIDDGGCELPIGYGYVNNIQDKMIQIRMERILKKYKNVTDEIVKGNANILKRIQIKSHINQKLWEEIHNEQ
jgi:hypothetical protein